MDKDRKRLDITTIRTVEDLNSTDFESYVWNQFKSYVKWINSPVAQADLDRVCALSRTEGSMVALSWSMGELYFHRFVLPYSKPPEQVSLDLEVQ